MSRIPEKPSIDGLEAKWRALWDERGTYRFDRSKARADVFSIDTPPPTVSGDLHPGHACSYSHTDFVARFQRMSGKEVFYPMGWDDNGLNVERRVGLIHGVRCDPSLPYDPEFQPPGPRPKGEHPVPCSRPNFVELCGDVVEELESRYQELWSTLGLSVDWSHGYTTIGAKATRVSQLAFLALYERGLVYRSGAPTLWDIDMRTAVAQAELAERDVTGAYHRLLFATRDGGHVAIDTTRPELLPGCVAVVAHPDDDRYGSLMGTTVTTPLFGVEVPVLASDLAEPERGTGIAMVCTFGDTTDVIWWRELSLELRPVIGHDGRMLPLEWGTGPWLASDADRAQRFYDDLTGRTSVQARKRIVEMLGEEGALVGQPREITHPVKFWENGTRPLEIVTSNQWFVRYPDKDDLLRAGTRLAWHPPFMQVRYEDWVNGLFGDWNITRQRFFGVPFPAWYRLDDNGDPDWLSPILAGPDDVPLDPTTEPPPGFEESQRDRAGGFTADPDVMDTWNTSSMSPQIIAGWPDDADLFERVYPTDLRPQAHEIIRTWLFYSVVKAHYLFDGLPWAHAAISGFVVDPDRKKLSKSVGNNPDEPMALIERYGADAVRYWAAGARPGMDLTLDHGRLKVGRRLAIKVLNASRFVLGLSDPADAVPELEGLDASLIARLGTLVDAATGHFSAFDYARVLERTESFFWAFTDDHLELVKARAYGSRGDGPAASARRALDVALSVQLRLLAPFLPFTTEEVWSWFNDDSIHRAPWPSTDEFDDLIGEPGLGDRAAVILGAVRKAKTSAGVSMKAPVSTLIIQDTPDRIEELDLVVPDLVEAGNIAAVTLRVGDPAIEVAL